MSNVQTGKLTKAQVSRLRKRAETIFQKADNLGGDMVTAFGVCGMVGGDNITDFSDDVTEVARTLISILKRCEAAFETDEGRAALQAED